MEYKKRESISYNPRIVQLSLGNYTVAVNYSEITDESCLEFSHVHTDFEIYYCLEGTMHLMAGDTCVEMKENTLTVLKPGVYHHTLYEPKNLKRYFIFVFEMPVKSALKTKGDGSEKMDLYLETVIQYLNDEQAVTMPDRYGCRQIIDELEREMDQDLPGREEMIRAFYTQYLTHVFRNLDVSHEICSSKDLTDQGNVNLALELTQFMHDNYSRNISVRDAAEAFHISERHVGRIFDKYFGKSFKNTLNIYRINYAKNYLLDTDYSIEKIADLVGISSTRKFHQLFREMEQMTAAEYRARHKGRSSHYGVHVPEPGKDP
ncbi:MAG: helix-turn-helix domain-containing protein [Eubacterium sp.]|nr:helix-turn-helix domain-containing protein [Eubacterium sp.]